jgi:predicted ArsR family transcriptional regulator
VNLPERRYELAGRVLAEAISNAERRDIPVNRAVAEAARAAGRSLGEPQVEASEAGEPLDPLDPLVAVAQALAANGYQPRIVDGRVILANCPFNALAETHRDLVCGLNRNLIDGLLDTLPGDLKACLDPLPGRCCVTVGD